MSWIRTDAEVYLWFVNTRSLFVLFEKLVVNSEKTTAEYTTKQ